MVFIRYLLAISLFIAGIFCVIRFFMDDWNWIFLLAFAVCIILAYWIKPATSRRQRTQRRNSNTKRNHDWLDLIDLPIEFLFQVISWPFRLLGKLLKHLDIDFSPDL